MRRYHLVTKTATETAPYWTNVEVAMFHYYNPNGLYAAKKNVNEEISVAVDEGRAKTGAFIAYGSLNSRNCDKLGEMATKGRIGRIDLKVTLEMLRDDISSARAFLDSIAEVAVAA
jgi:hypothetical protein